ncbi:MAG: OmpA/MotB domain protein [Crocinitomicaceae bacterium]|nr:OmpA/MotB domain protein [Crocinitomicaceae bacterium]
MYKLFFLTTLLISFSSCMVSKKKYTALKTELEAANARCTEQLAKSQNDLYSAQGQVAKLNSDLVIANSSLIAKTDQVADLKEQLADCKALRDKQLTQVGDLTVLTQAANDNIKETLSQLESKDKYITLLQAAKTKADSINLALAVNLKSVLKEGLDDQDVDIKVDKTVVFINLSDKVLYKSGSSELTAKADEVLAKIAKIIESRPELEVMVEGYTDNVPIKNNCMIDNWDLSVKRATSVVRALQTKYNINPNRLIAAGRGEYNTLVPNDSPANMSTNRRTRIIILPKINEFYDLLNPKNVPQ